MQFFIFVIALALNTIAFAAPSIVYYKAAIADAQVFVYNKAHAGNNGSTDQRAPSLF